MILNACIILEEREIENDVFYVMVSENRREKLEREKLKEQWMGVLNDG